MSPPKYSIVIPVFNRPEELDELLESLTTQTANDFEVLIVEDGSTLSAKDMFEKYSPKLRLEYFFKPNSGPGPSRNFGFAHAHGEYLVVFDSDCILPPGYFAAVEKFLETNPVDAWGGPDRGHEKFTPLQQAMAFTMSSVLTTGGIRGGKNQADGFQPRSFNMGMSRKVFEKTEGFKFDRLAEDIELSIRIKKAGFRSALIADAFVYHKRRATFRQFFRQVQGFGRGRVRVGNQHPEEVKVTHWFPSFFLLGLLATPFLLVLKPALGWSALLLLSIYLLAIFVEGLKVTHSLQVALLGIPSAVVQLTGYGYGFIHEKLTK